MSATPFGTSLSHLVGWLADRRIPRRLRKPIFRAYARHYDVDLSEVRLALEEHPSFAAFFVRRLRDGARRFEGDPRSLPAPCDGRLQACDRIERGTLLQAKGRPYALRELLGPVAPELELEGGHAWTIYLAPRDYHRVHAPLDGELVEAAWLDGARFSVAPSVLLARERVLSINERCVMRLESARGPLLVVMVGALNVGRIRVVGVEAQASGRLAQPKALARGDELARFEMGSTVIVIAPPGGARPLAGLTVGASVRMGQALGEV